MMAVGARHALAPVLDIARDPCWGRVEETYGEDPVLTGTIGIAYVQGLSRVAPQIPAWALRAPLRGRDSRQRGLPDA